MEKFQKLSPYISRGVITTKQVYEKNNSKNLPHRTSRKVYPRISLARLLAGNMEDSKRKKINTDLINGAKFDIYNEIPAVLVRENGDFGSRQKHQRFL